MVVMSSVGSRMDAHEHSIDWPSLLEGFSRNQHYMYGYVTSEARLQQVLEVYKGANTTTFCTRTSTTMQWSPTEKYCLRAIIFSKSSSPHVQWDGVPFVLGGRKILECQFGPGRGHKKKCEKPSSGTSSDYEPAHKRRQMTTKKGCEAKLVIKQIYRFPQYKTGGEKYQSTECSRIKLRLLKALKEMKDVTREERYYVELPLDDAHTNHTQEGCSDTAQALHPQLTMWIEELVEEGMTDSMEIQAILKRYLNDKMSDAAAPHNSDLTCYPKLKDIKNHIVCQTRKVRQRLTKMDQENLSSKLGQWRKDGAKQHFRPYRRASSTGHMNARGIRQSGALEQNDSSPPADEKTTDHADHEVREESLLLVHQEKWQQDVMVHHGNAICLLDPTYKNINLDLALYLVCVLTNGGYVVVAMFIIQHDRVAPIREALDVLRAWNPHWKPRFWMTDDSDAGFGALRGAFPDSSVYLGDFYREQAWARWIQNAEHGLSREDGEQLLRLLGDVAAAPPGQTEDGTHYEASVDGLKSSALWGKPRVKAWLEAKWLCGPERWARAHRDDLYHLAVDTGDGVESLNTFLRHSFLRKAHGGKKTMSDVVDALINRYLPARWLEYVFSQRGRRGGHGRCPAQVPESLQRIPAATAKLCLVNMGKAEEIEESCVRPVDVERGVFKVKESDPVPWCTVDFGTTSPSPSCSCRAYTQAHTLCQHFFAVFLHRPEWGWDKLPASYLKGPYLTGQWDREPRPSHEDDQRHCDGAKSTTTSEMATIRNRKRLHEELELLKAMSNNCSDVDVLSDLTMQLENLQDFLKYCLQKSHGGLATL